ncbi:hypothetical protein K7X08_006187 [Anisodus acutangulus]|uniref:Uncharacterized protein n=1 Tax=Anisodus acutangulus TaxID=402998 RepID=A0A9Q1RSD7_9SOLA|nr:hypothetical protein K7X08_006187 [Anisodus acutangulus]
MHTDCADLDVDGNQGVRMGDENMKDITSNDVVGGGDSSKETVGGVGDGVGVGVGEGNDTQSEFVFDSVSESAFAFILKSVIPIKKSENEKVPDVNVNTHDLLDDKCFKHLNAGNESVDGGLSKESEFVLAPPLEDIVQPQDGQLADVVLAKAEDTMKGCGVGPF